MSKPIYEIPVTGDETPDLGFPPPAAGARPTSYSSAPPPAPAGAAAPPASSWPTQEPPKPTQTFNLDAMPAPSAAAPSAPPAFTPPSAGDVYSAPLAAPSFPPPTSAPIAPPVASAPAPSFPPPALSAVRAPTVPFPAPVAELPAPTAPTMAYPAPVAELPASAPVAPPAPSTPAEAAAALLQFPAPEPTIAPHFSEPEPVAELLNFPPPSLAGTPVTHGGSSTENATAKMPDKMPDLGVPVVDERADPDLITALREVLFLGASDLHVSANMPPMVRVDGALMHGSFTEAWTPEKVGAALRSIMTDQHVKTFEENLELDFAYTVSSNARFRVNMYQQRDAMGAAFRLIPTEIKQLKDLGIPETIARFATLPRGLVLVTGPTGSGKSTTLAALVDLVNRTRADHIMTVEDPIEFMHGNHKSLVNQREVGHDTLSFNNALKHVLRQDPDVILIGELRDLETISVALTAAETGHLVFATLHTQDAAQTIDRIIDVFPPHQQGQVRSQLAGTLQGVVCQTLVKRASGKGRVVATEVLIATSAVANLIREGKTYQISSAMQAGGDLGMHTMDRHLADLANEGIISQKAAIDKAQDPEGLKQMIHRIETANESAARALASTGMDFNDAYSGAN